MKDESDHRLKKRSVVAKAQTAALKALRVLTLLAVLPGIVFGAAYVTETKLEVSAIDLRPTFTNWALPLRLQGNRGTCSVFTMTGALEFALSHQRQKGTTLSVEFLNWASNQATRNSHDGGFFSDLWKGFAAYGLCVETNLPYRADYDPNLRPETEVLERSKELIKAGLKMNWIKHWDVRTGLTERQFGKIKQVLAQGWPVCGGFRWPKQERWRERVLQMAQPDAVFDGHSVLLVGFRNDSWQPGGGVFLIRNSGGGVHDAAMSFEYVRAYMNDALWIDHDLKADQ